MARIMSEGEFNSFYETVKKELAHMEPGGSKRVALIGAVEGYAGDEIAFTGAQLRKIFNLGFREEVLQDGKDVCNLQEDKTGG